MTHDKVTDHPNWDKYKYTKNTGGVATTKTVQRQENMSDQGFGKSTDHLTSDVTTVSGMVVDRQNDVHNQNENATEKYTVYKWRWYVLGTLAVLNFSNAMVSYLNLDTMAI